MLLHFGKPFVSPLLTPSSEALVVLIMYYFYIYILYIYTYIYDNTKMIMLVKKNTFKLFILSNGQQAKIVIFAIDIWEQLGEY